VAARVAGSIRVPFRSPHRLTAGISLSWKGRWSRTQNRDRETRWGIQRSLAAPRATIETSAPPDQPQLGTEPRRVQVDDQGGFGRGVTAELVGEGQRSQLARRAAADRRQADLDPFV